MISMSQLTVNKSIVLKNRYCPTPCYLLDNLLMIVRVYRPLRQPPRIIARPSLEKLLKLNLFSLAAC
jgi:hypothetical protein